MINQAEAQSQSKDSRSNRLQRIGWAILFLICVLVARFIGKPVGLQAVQEEVVSQGAPAGFLGANLLMSEGEVKSLFPDAIEASPSVVFSDKALTFRTCCFSRPAFVTLEFSDNLLWSIRIHFEDEISESSYRKTHYLLIQEYGPFCKPYNYTFQSTEIPANWQLVSEKTIGPIVIEHIWRRHEKVLPPSESVTIELPLLAAKASLQGGYLGRPYSDQD